MIRIFGSPFRHVFERADDDERIGWTVCGMRFAWSGSRWDWSHDPVVSRTDCRRCRLWQ